MLDRRIYTRALLVVAVALIVVAFSLESQQGALQATLTPDAFSGSTAYSTMQSLAAQYPNRRPGSPGDTNLATAVAQTFHDDGFVVGRSVFGAQTVDGRRTLETVTGTLAGSTPGAIVVVAHRDSNHSPGLSDLSGTAVLLELAQMLSAQTEQRTIVLASTSGSVGASGAEQLAGSLSGPVDAVIVLGDMAGTNIRHPVVVPWSGTTLVAPPMLRNTVSSALEQQAGISSGDESIWGQSLQLAFPLTASEQRPFVAAGEPAVLISTSSSRAPAADERPSAAQIDAFGRTVLQAVGALNTGPEVPGPSSYLGLSGMLIPAWAIQLLVLALIAPVLAATIDGLARARRRGYSVARWVLWVLSAAVPFVLAVLAVVCLRLVGLIDAAPPGPVGGDALTLDTRAIAILIGLACLIALSGAAIWYLRRRMRPEPAAPTREARSNGHGRRHQRGPDDVTSPGAAAALLLVLCLVTLVIWVGNPFAAALMVPALHLWLWIVGPERRPRPALAVVLFALGLLPGALAGLYYAMTLGLGPAAAAWNAVLMLAGGDFGVVRAVEWSLVMGCVVSLGIMIVRIARQPQPADASANVRGVGGVLINARTGGTQSIDIRSAVRR
jgi:hypothetical protein